MYILRTYFISAIHSKHRISSLDIWVSEYQAGQECGKVLTQVGGGLDPGRGVPCRNDLGADAADAGRQRVAHRSHRQPRVHAPPRVTTCSTILSHSSRHFSESHHGPLSFSHSSGHIPESHPSLLTYFTPPHRQPRVHAPPRVTTCSIILSHSSGHFSESHHGPLSFSTPPGTFQSHILVY